MEAPTLEDASDLTSSETIDGILWGAHGYTPQAFRAIPFEGQLQSRLDNASKNSDVSLDDFFRACHEADCFRHR